jgi:hypothetical protein
MQRSAAQRTRQPSGWLVGGCPKLPAQTSDPVTAKQLRARISGPEGAMARRRDAARQAAYQAPVPQPPLTPERTFLVDLESADGERHVHFFCMAPIQREAIPLLREGHDLIGLAGTGTGKTAAFSLPMIDRLAASPARKPASARALVLVPTRELAMQVSEAIHKYARGFPLSVVPLYGGAPMDQQIRSLRRGADIVVATPGRALDHLRRQTLDLGNLEVLSIMQNGGMASALAINVLNSPAAGLGPAIFGPLMNISGSVLANWWHAHPAKENKPQ